MSSGERQTLSADGNTSASQTIGPVRLSLTGGFGSGTAQLQAKDPSNAWISVANGAFTAATDTLFDFPEDSVNDLRVNISSSTNPTLVIWLQWS